MIKALAVLIILILSLLIIRRVVLRREATSQVTPTPQTSQPSKFTFKNAKPSPAPQTKFTAANPFGVMISGDSSQIKAQTAKNWEQCITGPFQFSWINGLEHVQNVMRQSAGVKTCFDG